jgi:hypothetical protein
MLSDYFYHERIRKSVAMFGSLFNNIYVLRKDGSGNVISTQKVPLSYAPKRDFLERIRENPDLYDNTKVAIKLPRMSFEIIGYQYDAQRQLQKMNNYSKTGSANDNRAKINAPVPYSISMQLNVYAKTQDDALQVVEQILPYFTPQYTLTIKPFSDYNDIKEDVPIILQGMSYLDDYEGNFGRRTIIYQLDFLMHANFYLGIANSQIIRQVDANLYVDVLTDSDGFGNSVYPQPKLTVLPNPLNVSADSDYGFTETFTYVDSA